MYGSGGRGRQSRGRGHGFGRGGRGQSQRRGPALPSALIRELGGDTAGGGGRGHRGGGGSGGGGSGFRGRSSEHGRGRGGRGLRSFGGDRAVDLGGGRGVGGGVAGGGGGGGSKRRYREDDSEPSSHSRQAKDHHGTGEQRPAKRRQVVRDEAEGRARVREPHGAGGLTRTLAAMKQRQAGKDSRPGGSGPGSRTGTGSAAGASSKTKFHELLVDGWESRNGREAFLEELRLQARLAKRLGKRKKDALDGMDKLLGLMSAGSESMLPKYLDRESRQEAEDLLARSASGSGSGERQRLERPGKGGAQPASAAAAAQQVADLLDRESDEELEFFGIDPGNREGSADVGEDSEDEARRGVYGFGSGSDSESEDEGEGEDEDADSEGDGDVYGSGSDSGDLPDDGQGEEEDEGDGEDDDDGYDMLGQLMGSDSDLDEGAGGGDDDDDDDDGDQGEEDDDGDEDGDEGGRRKLAAAGPRSRRQQENLNGESGSDDVSEDEDEMEEDVSEVEDETEDDEPEDEDEQADLATGKPQASGRRSALADAAAAGAGASGTTSAKYVPPALRAQLAGGSSDPARLSVERRVTGLINRLAEANLQPIARDVAELYRNQGRRLVSEAVAAQILGAAESGPRASEQFAAVAAAFVAAVAALTEAQDLVAGFLAALAERLEAARTSGDSLAQANLVTLLGYCYSAGLVGPGLCYSLLGVLKDRFQEADVSAMVTLLNAVGLQLRNADPALMKEFVLGVHTKAAQLGKDGQISRRAQLMLDLIIDIKNNKTSAAGGAAAAVSLGGTATRKGKGAAAAAGAAGTGAGGGGRRGGALAVLQPSVSKWLQQLGVEEVCLRGLTWQKLLAPNKKGMWWMPVAGEALDDPLLLAAAAGGDGAATVAAAAASPGAAAAAAAASTARLLQLAAAQRMNTDARRAVFVAIMGSEDCAEAHEKLLRLPLKGDQRREIVRVLVDCCLSEKAWNPYYAFLALRLCGGGEGAGGGGGGSLGRAHRVTMQYCLWDKLKEVESMDVRQLTHLAKLMALLVARFALSLSLLKVVDWSDLSAKQLLTWRIFLQHLMANCKTAGDVKEVVARVASQPKTLSVLISGLLLFLRSSFAPWVATKLPPGPESDELLRRTRVAEKELAAGAATAAAVLI